MSLDWAPFVDLVRRNQRFLLTTHVRPDGDGLGSILALGDVLRRQGKEVQLVMPAPCRAVPVPGSRQTDSVLLPTGRRIRNIQVAMVLDTGTWNQLDSFGPFCAS